VGFAMINGVDRKAIRPDFYNINPGSMLHVPAQLSNLTTRRQSH
jgi:hypothetical protein